MKALVERLSADLEAKYVHYIETLLVDLWSEAGFIEFRAAFTLRRDHVLRSYVVKVEADSGETEAEREMLIEVVFDEIREALDRAIADDKVTVN